MTFDEWWEKFCDEENDIGDEPDYEAISKIAWEVAIKQAAQTARDQAKRYTCSQKKSICIAIGDTIEAGIK
jgi:hypothetical protein